MKVLVIGTGYVGLVTGACLADVGIDVCCIDIDAQKIDNLRNGVLPIYEPGLHEIVIRNHERGRLDFHTSMVENLEGVETVFIAVGTPPGEDGSADMKYVLSVATQLGTHMKDYIVVVTKSTVPVGSSKKVQKAIQDALEIRGVDIPFDVASNPEFLKEGAAVSDFLKPDRIVLGAETDRAKEVLLKVYHPFVLNGHPLLFMDIPSAEMTKYAANAMLATRISFMNDIAALCELTGADVNKVRQGIGSDPRIGNKFLYPGMGYGGSCFPKDVKALIRTGKEYGHDLHILLAVESVNERQKTVLFHKMETHFMNSLKGKIIAVWGLAFKPNTDDMREAPSLVLIENLLSAGATVRVFDPVAIEEAKHTLGDKVTWCKDIYEAATGSDAIALVTEWNEFRLPEWERVAELVKDKVVFDGRNIYDKTQLNQLGFSYYSIGKT